MNDGTVSAAGEAELQTNLLTKRFTNVTVRLNRYYLLNSQYGYSYERIVNTAEHELGHAIGLEHNEEKIRHAVRWIVLWYSSSRCSSSKGVVSSIK